MTDGTWLPQVAVLIDADNTPASGIGRVFADLAPRGRIVVRRAYGNWAKPQLEPWQGALLEHAIQAVHQYDHAVGKNATDMAMTIDAMDLLYTDCPHIVALVSSDADFTPLALRLRSAGVTVLGYGGPQANDAFRRACTEFVSHLPTQVAQLRQVPARPPVAAPAKPVSKTAPEPQKQAAQKVAPQKQVSPAQKKTAPQKKTTPQKQVPTLLLRGDTALMNRLRNAVTEAADASGWAGVGKVGSVLKDAELARRYGYSTLKKLLQATDAFLWRNEGQPQVAVRLKQAA